jgi:hypothetical protein
MVDKKYDPICYVCRKPESQLIREAQEEHDRNYFGPRVHVKWDWAMSFSHGGRVINLCGACMIFAVKTALDCLVMPIRNDQKFPELKEANTSKGRQRRRITIPKGVRGK